MHRIISMKFKSYPFRLPLWTIPLCQHEWTLRWGLLVSIIMFLTKVLESWGWGRGVLCIYHGKYNGCHIFAARVNCSLLTLPPNVITWIPGNENILCRFRAFTYFIQSFTLWQCVFFLTRTFIKCPIDILPSNGEICPWPIYTSTASILFQAMVTSEKWMTLSSREC